MDAVSKAGCAFTVSHEGQSSEWFEIWSTKLHEADICVIIFSEEYRHNFTSALLMEADAILQDHNERRMGIYIFDPAVHSAAVVRANLMDNISNMGNIQKWKEFIAEKHASGDICFLHLCTWIISLLFVFGRCQCFRCADYRNCKYFCNFFFFVKNSNLIINSQKLGEPARNPVPPTSKPRPRRFTMEGSDMDEAAFMEAAIRELSEWMKTAVKISPAASRSYAEKLVQVGVVDNESLKDAFTENIDLSSVNVTTLELARLKRVLGITSTAASPTTAAVVPETKAVEPVKPKRPPTYECIQTMTGHTKSVFKSVFALAIHDGRLFSGSVDFDKSIKVWDLSTYLCIQTMTGHTNPVNALAIHDGRLVSGSYDNSIKVWDLSTYSCIQTMKGHTNYVVALAIHDGRLFSGSDDNSIKVWDLSTYLCIQTMTGHTNPVRALAIHDGRLFSGSDDKSNKVWDLSTYSCIQTMTGHTSWVCALAIHDGRLFSGSGDKSIKVWDLSTYSCIKTLTGHTDYVRALAIHDGRLFSGSGDNSIKVWDLSTYSCIQTMTGHTNAVVALTIHDGRLFSGSDDNSIKVWDI